MRPLLFATFVLTGFGGGCATRATPVDTQVRAIHFHDNGPWLTARSEAALRQAMGHPKPSGIWPLRRMATLDEDTLRDDEGRLAVHYAHQGYFDAELVHWEFREVREANDKHPPVVVLVGTIDPGEPTTVAAVEVASDDLSPPAQAVVDRELRRGEGKRFLLSTHDDVMASAEQAMGNLSFAHAAVDGEVEVDRPRHLAVRRYDVVPGPPSTFGAVTIDAGEGTIPDSVFRRQLKIAEGESYALDAMSLTRRRLYSLGVFSSVEVEPQLEGSDDVVPVAIRMVPRDPRGVLFGVGLALEGGRQQALGRFRFEHLNIRHTLLTFALEATGGYALLSSSIPTNQTDFSTIRGGPVLDVTASTSAPVLGWQAGIEAGYLRNVTEAFVTSQPSAETTAPTKTRSVASCAARARATPATVC